VLCHEKLLCGAASSKILAIAFTLCYAAGKPVIDVQVGGRVAIATRSTAKEVRVLAKQRSDKFTELEERYAGYEVYDRDGEKIGKVDDLFVDESDNPEYIGVKMGLLGTKSTSIPMDIATVREDRGIIEVATTKGKIKDGPEFDDDEEITPEYEERVRSHYGSGSLRGASSRGVYGAYYSGLDENYARKGAPP